jgi:TPR repeat protein
MVECCLGMRNIITNLLRPTRDVSSPDQAYKMGLEAYERGDFRRALQEWLPLASENNARAQRSVAVIYYNGQGIDQDYAEAMRWYRRAAEQGDQLAQLSLGTAHEFGEGVVQDHTEAVRWYRMAADQGNPSAQFSLGLAYENGRGAPKDLAQAARWYRRAADQGDQSARLRLAGMADKGVPVEPHSEDEAGKSHRKIVQRAEWGDAHAECLLGSMYYDGDGVSRDHAEAAKWWRRAAEQGEDSAQTNLASLYLSGSGVPQSDVEAYKWCDIAVANGNKNAGGLRNSLIEVMTPAQIAEGQKLARQWMAAFKERAEK